jgi:hypothetical protein
LPQIRNKVKEKHLKKAPQKRPQNPLNRKSNDFCKILHTPSKKGQGSLNGFPYPFFRFLYVILWRQIHCPQSPGFHAKHKKYLGSYKAFAAAKQLKRPFCVVFMLHRLIPGALKLSVPFLFLALGS